MIKTTQFQNTAFQVLSIVFFGFLLLESFMYPGFLGGLINVPVSIWHLVFIGFVSLGVVAYSKPSFVVKGNYVLFFAMSICTLVALLFFFLESTQYSNYVFSTFHVHPNLFFAIPVFLYSAWLISFFRSKKKNLINSLLFICSSYGILLLLRVADPTLFEAFGSEDGLIEWLSVIALLGASGLAIWKLRAYKKVSVIRTGILLAIVIATLVVAGEEVSWGQRVFNLQTPDSFAEINVQGETTIHNVHFIQDKMFYAYLLVGMVGSFGWIAKQYVLQKNNSQLARELAAFIPSKKHAVFFTPILLYSLMRISTGPINYKTWEESVELFLFCGFSLSLFD